jgi:hypothetical protein
MLWGHFSGRGHAVDVCTQLTKPTGPVPGQPPSQEILIRFRPGTSALPTCSDGEACHSVGQLGFRHGRRALEGLYAPATAWAGAPPFTQ